MRKIMCISGKSFICLYIVILQIMILFTGMLHAKRSRSLASRVLDWVFMFPGTCDLRWWVILTSWKLLIAPGCLFSLKIKSLQVFCE